MKIAFNKAALLQTTLLLCGFAAPAFAQTPVTVPPATAPAAAPASVATNTAPPVAPATQMPTAAPAMQMPVAAAPTAQPMESAGVATVAPAPAMQPAMPSPMPVAAVTAPPMAGMPTGTPAVVTQVMGNLQDAQNNVSVEDLSKAQDALTRLDLLLQIEKKIGEIKKTQDDRESGGSAPGGMVGQIPASALVLPGQTPGAMGIQNGMQQGSMSGMPSPVISHAPANGSYEIEQISGTNGNYNAILTTPDGDRKTVRAGDKLDGRTVQSISLNGVQLSAAKGSKKGGKTLTIHNDGVLLTPMVR